MQKMPRELRQLRNETSTNVQGNIILKVESFLSPRARQPDGAPRAAQEDLYARAATLFRNSPPTRPLPLPSSRCA